MGCKTVRNLSFYQRDAAGTPVKVCYSPTYDRGSLLTDKERNNMYKALKLDASYRPIGIVSSLDALVTTIVGKATILETHDRKIRSAYNVFDLPSVIVINRVARRGKTFPCNRDNVFIRDKGTCQYCGKKLTKATCTLDHVVPKSRGGIISWNNIVLCCHSCNQKKGDRTPEQAGLKLASSPKPLSYREYLLHNSIDSEAWKDYL